MSEKTYVTGFRKTTPPIGIIFAYNSKARQDDTFKNWFKPNNEQTTPLYPSLTCCLDLGMVSFSPQNTSEGVSLTSTHPEIGMKLECKTFPVVRKKTSVQGEIETENGVQFLQVPSQLENSQYLPFEGNNYPIKKIGKHYMAIDQSRVLLVFLLQLADLLAQKKIHPGISFMDTYTKALDTFHFTF